MFKLSSLRAALLLAVLLAQFCFFFSTNTQNTEFCSFAGAVVVANVDVKSLLAASSARFNRIVHAFDCRVECSLQESKQYRRLVESLQIIVQFVLIKTRLRL